MSEEILKGILPEVYYVHWSLLVEAYRILMKKCIKTHEIDYVEYLLDAFVYGVDVLYGSKYCTIKVHQLLHVGKTVRNFGPLSNVSSYKFESINGDIMEQNTATLSPIEQLHTKFQRLNWIRPILHSMHDSNGTPITKSHPFVTYLSDYIGWNYSTAEIIPHNWRIINNTFSYRKCTSSIYGYDDDIRDIIFDFGFQFDEIELFHDFKIEKLKFHTRFASIYKNDSRWIQFQSNGSIYCGEILLGVSDLKNSQHAVVVEMCAPIFMGHKLSGSVDEEKRIIVVEISDIIDQCVYVQQDSTYSLFPLHSYRFLAPILPLHQLITPIETICEHVTEESYAMLRNNPKYRHKEFGPQ
jgi:hypothetical protein